MCIKWIFVYNKDSSNLVAPVGDSMGFEIVDTGWGSGDDRINVRRDAKISVESNSQYLGFPFPKLAWSCSGWRENEG